MLPPFCSMEDSWRRWSFKPFCEPPQHIHLIILEEQICHHHHHHHHHKQQQEEQNHHHLI